MKLAYPRVSLSPLAILLQLQSVKVFKLETLQFKREGVWWQVFNVKGP